MRPEDLVRDLKLTIYHIERTREMTQPQKLALAYAVIQQGTRHGVSSPDYDTPEKLLAAIA